MRLAGMWHLLPVVAMTALVGCSGVGRVGSAPTSSPSGDGASIGPPATSPAGLTGLSFDADLRYTCGTFGFLPAFLDEVGSAETGDDPMAVALREHLATPDLEHDFLPDTGWSLVGSDADLAEFIAPSHEDVYGFVIVERGPNGWEVDGWRQCRPELVYPEGLGPAVWLPDPDAAEPNGSAKTLSVLVTERSCSSGRPSVGRVVGPAVRYEPDRVLVVFGVTPLPGGSECPGNPATPVIIELSEPLGDRELIDASSLPYVDVRTIDPLGY